VTEERMNSRHIASKLFFALAALCSLAGVAAFRLNVTPIGLTRDAILDAVVLVMVPRFIPFAASILSAGFGLFYFVLERNFNRPPNISLVLVHLVSFLLAIVGHMTLVRFWWRVLGDEHATIPLPVWAGGLEFIGLVACSCALAANIFANLPKAASAPRGS
jgi:hypothetical protein